LRKPDKLMLSCLLALVISACLASCENNDSSSPTPITSATSLPTTTASPSATATAPATPTASPTATPASAISGSVQGGMAPIAGSALTLYAAGATGPGSGAVALGSGTSDNAGNFTIHYNCPANSAAQTYVVALGGNPGSASNSAIGLLSLTGSCSDLGASTFVMVNELTTAAAQWAWAQFIAADGLTVGSSSTNAVGLSNASNQAVSNLVVSCGGSSSGLCSAVSSPDSSNTGVPASFWATNGATPAACAGSSPPVNCDGLERLNTLANIISACVASTGPSSSACAALFSSTGVSGGQSTLAAAHAIVTNPTKNVAALYALQAASTAPYQPNLATVPADFTIALNFSPSSANFNNPLGMSIDSAGNIWVANCNSTDCLAAGTSGSVTKLSAIGGVVGNFNNTNTSGANFASSALTAIDESGNLWIGNYAGNSITELGPNGSLIGNFNNTNTTGANFDHPRGIAIDTLGNAWVANVSGNSVTVLNSSGALVGNFDPSGANIVRPYGIAIDSLGNAWVTNQGSNSVTELTGSGTLVGNFNPSGANFNEPLGIAIDASGNGWIANARGGTVSELDSSGGLVGNFNPSGANFSTPVNIAIDSLGNAWVANLGTISTASSITALNSNGEVIGNFSPPDADLKATVSIALDASGNVWATNELGNSISEFVGLAAPVKTPLVTCLKASPAKPVCAP